jgi:hypothetical protein
MNTALHHTAQDSPDQPVRRILPPYSKYLDPALWPGTLFVLTGSGAEVWEMAKSRSWFPGQKVLLPYGEAIGRYRWPVSGRDCIVASYGNPEPRKRLIELSCALVQDGATFVLWLGLETPSPIFRPVATGAAA